jgi:polyisoprenoid-binding protein YceI
MRTDVDRGTAVPTTPMATGRTSHRRRWSALAATGVLTLGGAGVWWAGLRGDPPPRAGLDQALAGLPGAAATSIGTTISPSTTAAPSPVEGTWSIDRTITNLQGTGSFTGFRIDEVLAGVGSATAVGRTSAVEGTLTVHGTTLTAARVNANLTGITTDDARRDSAVQRALDTSRFPNATFVLTTPVDVGAVPAEGRRITVAATGDLTIHGVTREVALDLEVQLQSGVLVVVGSTGVVLSDYGVTAPSAPMVVGVDDHAILELQLYFTRR